MGCAKLTKLKAKVVAVVKVAKWVYKVTSSLECQGFTSTCCQPYSQAPNEAPSDVNRTFDGSIYPVQKICKFIQVIFCLVNQNASGYIVDQCCHLQRDGSNWCLLNLLCLDWLETERSYARPAISTWQCSSPAPYSCHPWWLARSRGASARRRGTICCSGSCSPDGRSPSGRSRRRRRTSRTGRSDPRSWKM